MKNSVTVSLGVGCGVLVALLCGAGAPASAQDFALLQLTRDGVNQATNIVDRQLVVDAVGWPHIFFFGGPNTLTAVYRAWPPDPWVVEPVAAESTSALWPSAALAPDGSIHVVFCHWTDSGWIPEHTRIHGGIIDPPAEGPGGFFYPSVAVGPDGAVHVVATSELLIYSRNDGSGWNVEPIGNGSGGSIAVDTAGVCHVVYDDPDPLGTPRVYYVRGGWHAWSAPELLATPAMRASVAVSRDGRVHVAYVQQGDGIHYRVRSAGGTWSAPESVAPGAGAPCIAVDSFGYPYIAYWAPGPEVDLSYRFPTSWTRVRVDSTADPQPFEVLFRPSVAIGPGDDIHVSYYSWDGEDTEMWYAHAGRVVGVEAATPPRVLRLESAPNPVVASATIRFVLSGGGPVRLALYDVSGRLVHDLARGVLPAGENTVCWDGRDSRGRRAAAGLYLCRLTSAAGEAVRKIVVMP